jgi:hypothetical protein
MMMLVVVIRDSKLDMGSESLSVYCISHNYKILILWDPRDGEIGIKSLIGFGRPITPAHSYRSCKQMIGKVCSSNVSPKVYAEFYVFLMLRT